MTIIEYAICFACFRFLPADWISDILLPVSEKQICLPYVILHWVIPIQLAKVFRKKSDGQINWLNYWKPVIFKLKSIIARTGWTTSELWQGIRAEEIRPPYDLVSLLIGVNNQYRGYAINEYRDQFDFLLKKSIEYAGGDTNRVVVLSIPDWGVTPFASGRDREEIAEKIDEFNLANREMSEKVGVHYVDVTPVSRQALNDKTLIAADGLHPSRKMYAIWAEKTLPIVRDILIGSK
jgi:lysophospholipase L1-like esterase